MIAVPLSISPPPPPPPPVAPAPPEGKAAAPSMEGGGRPLEQVREGNAAGTVEVQGGDGSPPGAPAVPGRTGAATPPQVVIAEPPEGKAGSAPPQGGPAAPSTEGGGRPPEQVRAGNAAGTVEVQGGDGSPPGAPAAPGRTGAPSTEGGGRPPERDLRATQVMDYHMCAVCDRGHAPTQCVLCFRHVHDAEGCSTQVTHGLHCRDCNGQLAGREISESSDYRKCCACEYPVATSVNPFCPACDSYS